MVETQVMEIFSCVSNDIPELYYRLQGDFFQAAILSVVSFLLRREMGKTLTWLLGFAHVFLFLMNG